MNSKVLLIAGLLIFLVLGLTQCSIFNRSVDYNTEVKPILNSKCISCHGGVKQSGGFSLLSRDNALAVTESDHPAIVPGSSSESEFIRRLTLDDPEERMPLGNEPLTEKEIKILTKWVDQGAKWGLHWAYRPLEQSDEVLTMGGAANTSYIDEKVKVKLKEINLDLNPKASKSDLLRRSSFDLIGMPAPLELQNLFLDDEIDFETLLDSLISMPAFGEKWATMWLDIARYADSKGFERDQSRSIWRYRDYVISAFNNDKPYNDFIVEQLAGDMLENPTTEQYIATGFHRNTQTNDEGGTNNEEFRVAAVLDRVSTTWEGILGTTMACVQCHGHPYDPFPHTDFYETYAFLNNTRDNDTYMDYPLLNFLDSLSETQLKEMTDWVANVSDQKTVKRLEDFVKINQPIIYSIETDELIEAAFYDTKYLGFRQGGSARIPSVDLSNKEALWMTYQNSMPKSYLSLHIDSLNGREIGRAEFISKTKGYDLVEIELAEVTGIKDIYLRYSSPTLKGGENRGFVVDWFHFGDGFPGEKGQEREDKFSLLDRLLTRNHESTPILVENEEDRRRKSYLFDRGNWQIPAQEVEPNTPSILPPMDETISKNRLGFAKWIASDTNPLTSRTYANRIWEQLFGRGIVRTVEDLGSQGEKPSHPELLDLLAYHFVNDMEWSTKALIKTIMLSDTYQQSAVQTSDKQASDPYNIYLSRGPRNRLTAEQVRDQGLFLSGLLSNKMYGPSVMPYQPDGIWNSPYNNEKWQISEGEDRYRRAIYTMIKRTSLYPSMETFDMAARQLCTSRRIPSNTPLQALVTLNDPTYIEISEEIGRGMKDQAENLKEGISSVYKLAMSKEISNRKLEILYQLYLDSKEEASEDENPEEIALMTVSNAIINLDDLLNK